MPTRSPTAQYFKQIRTWEGRQTRAFEEMCFQLRDREPEGVELRKTSDPDGGLEWYWLYPNGAEVGWQCKFSDNESSLMSMMDASFESVRIRRPKARRLTFCISVDLSDDPDKSRGEFGWQRYEKLVGKWKERAPNLEVSLILGGQLLDRLALKEHQGREWFWFGAVPILHPEWCVAQREVAVDSVDERYRPHINVDLPIATTIAAVGQPEPLREHFDYLVEAASQRAGEVLEHRPVGGRFAQPIDLLAGTMRLLVESAQQAWTPQQPLSKDFVEVLTEARDKTNTLLNVSYEEAAAAGTEIERSSANEDARSRRNRAYSYEREARRLEASLEELHAWTKGPACSAASNSFLLLDGEGGAGKTHLFCEIAGQLIQEGHPVLLLLGQWFGTEPPWKTLAERIGGPDLSIDELVTALEASAEASNQRMVLMVDAINDGDFGVWRNHMRELRARLAKSRWIGVALSCRTTYLDAIKPLGGFGSGITRATHPGFAGREFEAMERIFNAYGIVEPRVPLLLPEFTNPLFLILYAESVSRRRVPSSGAAHLSGIFNAFVEARKEDIYCAPGFDPALDPLGKAIGAIASELGRRQQDHLPYEQANEIVQGLDRSGNQWPNTLFGRMLSTGLLTKDLAYMPDEGRECEAVRFPFQRFSDHLIVGGLLDAHLDIEDLEHSFAEGTPLHELVADGPLGSFEALAIQLPERCGSELPTIAINVQISEWRLRRAFTAFLRSVPARAVGAVDPERVMPLINQALAMDLTEEVTGALVACSPLRDHPLNGEWLHRYLSQQTLSERDAGWQKMTFWSYGDTEHPLDRLIRWAERQPYPEYDVEILELAALPLVWALASPNRFARDAATKALTNLLVGKFELAERLAKRFQVNDDPYITERLTATAYGALLRQEAEPDCSQLLKLLKALVEMLDQARPNILLRDHVAGVARYLSERLSDPGTEALIERALPPYGAQPPVVPRGIEELEQTYPSRGPNDEVGYGIVQNSVFTNWGDFHKYVMSGRISNFLRHRLDSQDSSYDPRKRSQHQYPDELAGRYIFERVIELGWTPEEFGEFDVSVSRSDPGRDLHKPERFGKKYQWIGLFELLARLADNYTLDGGWDEEPKTYEGAWQLSVRDIDPTLPPAKVRVIADERVRDPVFAPDPSDAWWMPPAPEFGPVLGVPGQWAERMDDLPTVDQLFFRVDASDTKWIVLDGHLNYEEERDPVRDEGAARRDLGFSIHGALVRLCDLQTVRTWFDTTADIMRVLPGWDAQGWGDSYLGEIPWAPAARELDTGWEVEAFRGDTEFPDQALEVAIPWHWPAGFDCSLDEALNMRLPSPQLMQRGNLRRINDTLIWLAEGQVAVRFLETDKGWGRDWALLAREEWLLEVLAREDLVFVAGSYGERRVFGPDRFTHEVLGWIDLGSGVLLAEGEWTKRGYDVLWDRRSGKDSP